MSLRPGILTFAIPALFFCVSAHAARQDGLVAYFTFDDPNDRLKNSAPSSEFSPGEVKKIGDALEMTFVPGKFGDAASFNNAGDSKRISDWAISLGNLDKLYEGDFTVAFWMRVDKSQSGILLGDKESFNIAPGWTVSQRFAAHYSVQTLGTSEYKAYTFGLERAGWTHVVLTVDRAEGLATFYVNGGKDSHKYKLTEAKAALGSGVATVIGASSNGTFGAKGEIDELGLWNRVLTKPEIEALGLQDKEHHGRRIPEASSVAWLGSGAAVAAIAAIRRRRKA